jgi:hypothetical protein
MAQVSFEQDVKALITAEDQAHMLFMFDLWSYDDVKSNALEIYDSVSNGRMPPASTGRTWSPDKVALFKQWMDDGYQK